MKVKTSGLIDDMSGSSGGTNAYRDRTGLHFRNKSGRVKCHSERLVRSQEKFYYVLTHWSKLNDRQMIAWNKLAQTFFKKDSLGNVFPYLGREMFQRFNRNLIEIEENIQLEPPQNLKVQLFKTFSVELTQVGDEISDMKLFIKPRIEENTKILIFATYRIKSGRLYINPDKYKIIGYVDSDFVSGNSILPLYQSVYVSPKAEYFKIGFHIKPVNKLTGIPSKIIEYISRTNE